MKTTLNGQRIRIAIISIDDKLYLPKVYQPLFNDSSLEIVAVFLIPPMSAINMHPHGSLGLAAIFRRFQLYGANAFLKLSMMYLVASCRRIISQDKSVIGLASAQNIPVFKISYSINDCRLINLIKEIKPDMLVGVFSEKASQELISSTHKGLMLLHYSLLPDFAGREPTFWTLLEAPQKGGITFFKATDRLDAGTILIQVASSLANVRTLHQAINILSNAASQHIISAVYGMFNGVESRDNRRSESNMKSWPRKSDRLNFLKKGFRFI